MCVSHFEIWRPAILQPVDPGKGIIPFWKALSTSYWNSEWKLEYLGPEKSQSNFSESGAFLVNWAWPAPGWCHTQFLYKFWKLCVRAFKWYIICGTFSTGRWFKWTKRKTLNLGAQEAMSPTVYYNLACPSVCLLNFLTPFQCLNFVWIPHDKTQKIRPFSSWFDGKLKKNNIHSMKCLYDW